MPAFLITPVICTSGAIRHFQGARPVKNNPADRYFTKDKRSKSRSQEIGVNSMENELVASVDDEEHFQ